MMGSDDQIDDNKPSALHWWGGALSGGTTVPWGGGNAAKEGIKGAVIGGLAGLNGRFDDDDDESIGRRSAVPCSLYILVHADRLFLG